MFNISFTSFFSAYIFSLIIILLIWLFCWGRSVYTEFEVSLLRISIILMLFRLVCPVEYLMSYSIYIKDIYYEFCKYMRIDIIYNISIIEIFVGASLWVSCFLLMRRAISYRRFLKVVRAGKRVDWVFVERRFRKVRIPVVELKGIKQSFIVGVFKPRIILGDNLDEKRSIIISHEIQHYLNHDLFYKWLFELVNILYWWNPMIYIIKRHFSNLLEVHTDFMILEDATFYEKMNYAELLLSMAKKGGTKKYGIGIKGEGSFLKKRVLAILLQKKAKKNLYPVICLLIAILSFGIVFEPENNYKFEEGQFAKESSYIIYENDYYCIYMNGKFVGKLEQVPKELRDINVYLGED